MSAADKLQELAKTVGAAFRKRSRTAPTLPEKIDGPANQPRRTLPLQYDYGGGDGIMNSSRLAQVTTALCGTVGLAGWVVASLVSVRPISKTPAQCNSRTAADHLSPARWWTHRKQPH
jgi:hypothetical protein